jgi:hypothetical protein
MSYYEALVQTWADRDREFQVTAQRHEEFAVKLVKQVRASWRIPSDCFAYFPFGQSMDDPQPGNLLNAARFTEASGYELRFRIVLRSLPRPGSLGFVFHFTINETDSGWEVFTTSHGDAHVLTDDTPASLEKFAEEFFHEVEEFLLTPSGGQNAKGEARQIGFHDLP